MRVAHVITDLGTGGAEMMLLKTIRATADRVDHTVISLSSAGMIGPMIEAAGVPVHALGIQRGGLSIAATRRLVAAIRELRPDVVQGWMYHGNLAALVAACIARVRSPVAWSIRCTIEEKRANQLSGLVFGANRLLSPWAAAIIYNAKRSRQQHEAHGFAIHRASVIANGFELDRFSPDANRRVAMRRQLGLALDECVIGYLARLNMMKDPVTFAQAAARVAEAGLPVKFVMAGPEIPYLVQQFPQAASAVAALGDRLLLLPEQRDAPALLAAFDWFALSSAWGEAFPNVIGEAMACGVPCIATDIGDCADLIDDTGLVVPPKDSEAFAQAMIAAVQMPDADRADRSRRARERMVMEYSLEASADRYLQEWQALANAPG